MNGEEKHTKTPCSNNAMMTSNILNINLKNEKSGIGTWLNTHLLDKTLYLFSQYTFFIGMHGDDNGFRVILALWNTFRVFTGIIMAWFPNGKMKCGALVSLSLIELLKYISFEWNYNDFINLFCPFSNMMTINVKGN